MKFEKAVEMNENGTIKTLYGFPVTQSNNSQDFELKLGRDILEPYINDKKENVMNEYILDLHDSGNWLIKGFGKTYHAGYNKLVTQNLIERLNNAHRPNIEEKDNSLYVCWNSHEKWEDCEYVLEIENCCVKQK